MLNALSYFGWMLILAGLFGDLSTISQLADKDEELTRAGLIFCFTPFIWIPAVVSYPRSLIKERGFTAGKGDGRESFFTESIVS